MQRRTATQQGGLTRVVNLRIDSGNLSTEPPFHNFRRISRGPALHPKETRFSDDKRVISGAQREIARTSVLHERPTRSRVRNPGLMTMSISGVDSAGLSTEPPFRNFLRISRHPALRPENTRIRDDKRVIRCEWACTTQSSGPASFANGSPCGAVRSDRGRERRPGGARGASSAELAAASPG